MNKIIRWLAARLWPEYKELWRVWFSLVAGLVALIGGITTSIALVLEPNPKEARWARTALVLWAVVPPFYFWFEYFVLWKPNRTITLDEIKYDQEVCRNIWLAFVALIAALYFK
jgi:hypothetical protein